MDFSNLKPLRLLCNIPLRYLPEMTEIVLMTMARMAKEGEVLLQDRYFRVAGSCFCLGVELSDDGREYEVWVQEVTREDDPPCDKAEIDPKALPEVSRYLASKQN